VIDSNLVEPAMNPRNQPGPGPVAQLPKGGFDHPFHDLGRYTIFDEDFGEVSAHDDEGKERPRIVSELDFPHCAGF